GELIDASDVAAGTVEAGDEADLDGITANGGDDRNCRGRLLCGEHPGGTSAYDDRGHLTADQIGRESRKSIELTLSIAVFHGHVHAFDKARLLQALTERCDLLAQRRGRASGHESDHRRGRLLRARRERLGRRAAENEDEIAALHSITSSARASSDGG